MPIASLSDSSLFIFLCRASMDSAMQRRIGKRTKVSSSRLNQRKRPARLRCGSRRREENKPGWAEGGREEDDAEAAGEAKLPGRLDASADGPVGDDGTEGGDGNGEWWGGLPVPAVAVAACDGSAKGDVNKEEKEREEGKAAGGVLEADAEAAADATPEAVEEEEEDVEDAELSGCCLCCCCWRSLPLSLRFAVLVNAAGRLRQ
jgi:hypothetical protein